MTDTARRTIRTMCPMNCHPTLCGMLVTVEGDDALVEVTGDRDNPDSRGFLCVRGRAAHEIIGNPERVLYPRARRRRGSDSWERIGWDEALDRIASTVDRLGRDAVGVWGGHGNVANDFGTFANYQLVLRFANMAGCQWWESSMICWGLGGFGIALTGALEANTKEDMSAHADLIVLWGSNFASQPNTARHVSAAKRRGARVVAIDVRVSEACRSADEYHLVRPGTDAALALALMHVIVAEKLYDEDFIAAHTVGFEALAEHVRRFTPSWGASVTGVGADAIVALARSYAHTARAMLLMSGSSMYKDRHGWMASRAISCLPPLTGKLGKPGAGFGPRHAGMPHGHGLANIVNFEARPPGDYIPNQMSAIIDAVCDGRLRAMLLFGTDMLSSFADTGRVGRGFDGMDLIVCHDLFMNETARCAADIVLPATSWLEDLGCKGTPTHLYLMDRALAPAGEARSSTDVVRALAERLGIDDFYPWKHDGGHIDAVLDHPATGHATVASLRAAGGIGAMNVSHVAHPDHRYLTPSGKIEFYSERAAAVGLPPLPEPAPQEASRYPLALRNGRTLSHFHSFYDHGRALPTLAARDPQPELWLAPADAAARGITDGSDVRVHNDDGEFRARVRVTDDVPAGTVWMHDGWPGLNTLMYGGASLPDAAVDIFGFTTGQSGYDARVEVAAD
ncbi:MAG: molybdopterin-dependent oxidoreductase [Gammaproteobacteria bacterium]|nr:molybdopterin-dependent oxidoreductase [Gammaproteobacteria bacterium]